MNVSLGDEHRDGSISLRNARGSIVVLCAAGKKKKNEEGRGQKQKQSLGYKNTQENAKNLFSREIQESKRRKEQS